MKYNELFRLLKSEGWYQVRQSGSHIVLAHREIQKQITLPFHAGKEVKKGLLSSILKETGIKTTKR